VAADPYVYPGTNVLCNLLDLRDAAELAQRAFLGQIAKAAGHPIAWVHLDAERNVLAARESHRGNNSPLREMFGDLLEQSAP